jgi:hypothetical protein
VEEASDDGVVSRLWDLAGRHDVAGGGAAPGDGGELDRLLVDLASAGPVAIAIDDAQWCNPETLRVLLRLAPWIETPRAKRTRVVSELPPAGSRAPANASVQVRLGGPASVRPDAGETRREGTGARVVGDREPGRP